MSDENRIFSLHYFGKRFKNNRIPVESLTDLSAFRDLLLSFAKDSWRLRHEDRKKLPKNFDKELQLFLFDIKDGSAIPQLEWQRNRQQEQLFPITDEVDDVVEEAYNNVINLFASAEQEPQIIDAEKVRALNRFGAALREGERIELTSRDHGAKIVKFDSAIRKNLITHSRSVYEQRIDGIAQITGLNSPAEIEKKSYVIADSHKYGSISIPVDRMQLYEEFEGNLNCNIQFEILAELDSNDRIRSVLDVYELFVTSEKNTSPLYLAFKNLDKIANLQRGWHDGDGVAPSNISVEKARSFLNETSSLSLDVLTFPTESGGVLIDFTVDEWDYSVEVSHDGVFEIYGISDNEIDELIPTYFQITKELVEFIVARIR